MATLLARLACKGVDLANQIGISNQYAADATPLPVDKFGRGVHDQIRAPFDRILQNRRRKHIIDKQNNAALATKVS